MGATFIDLVEGTTIYLASHQIRIHNSKETNFYLQARSNPIIEHCEALGFGDLGKTEHADAEAQKKAGLDAINLFNQVHDFNWLKQDHSPNWKLI